jgi:hypothetical protein
MAPNLAVSQHELIRDIIVNKFLKINQIIDIADSKKFQIALKL